MPSPPEASSARRVDLRSAVACKSGLVDQIEKRRGIHEQQGARRRYSSMDRRLAQKPLTMVRQRRVWRACALLLVACLANATMAQTMAQTTAQNDPSDEPTDDQQKSPWEGQWVTDLGMMNLTRTEGKIAGTYAKEGSVNATSPNEGDKAATLRGEYRSKSNQQESKATGKFAWTLSDDSESFHGSWSHARGKGTWRGWKTTSVADDDEAVNDAKPPRDFAGPWLSSRGVLLLKQDGAKITGDYGTQGWGSIEGTVRGERLDFKWNYLRNSGKAWLEQTPDGRRIFGASDEKSPTIWTGVNVDAFEESPKLVAGKTIQGRTSNGILYYLRMPDEWQPNESTNGDDGGDDGGEKDGSENIAKAETAKVNEHAATDLIVLLHGSNWTTRGMVHVTATKWPRLGRRFAILGIQGDNWVKYSKPDDLRFNYRYVNWMGRSTFTGYPNTNRESPYLVMKAIDELSQQHPFGRIFVGGHSQGGFLTYLLHMHFPEKLAGTFPVAGGLVMQAEPDVFDDDKLKASQRDTPMAIVHGTADRVVPFSTCTYIEQRLLAYDFPRTTVFKPSAGHAYDFLPIGDAIEWLDTMSTKDANRLQDFAQQAAKNGQWRDVATALLQSEALPESENKDGLNSVREQFEAAAKVHARRFRDLINTHEKDGGDWIDDFFVWRDAFGTAEAARETMTAFEARRSEHEPIAKKLKSDAATEFRDGNRDAGWLLYQRIVDECYASRIYRTTKTAVERRK